jgi:predicted porin
MFTRDYLLTETTYQSGVSAARDQRGKSLTMTHLGAAYDFGSFKLGGQIATVRNTQMSGETARTIDAVTGNLGLTFPVGDPHLFRINYVTTNDKRINNQDATSWALGYDYALSKRSTLYVGAAWVKNSNGAQFSANIATANALSGVAAAQTSAADGRTSAIYSGLSHTF